MHRTSAALIALAVAPALVAGCATRTGPAVAEPDTSPPRPADSSSSSPPTMPTLVFTVTNTSRPPVDDSADLEDNVEVNVHVTISGTGEWRRSGDLGGSGELTAAQTRELAALVSSDAFLSEMVNPKRRDGVACTAVMPQYLWTLDARGHTASPGCGLRRPTVARVVNMIERSTGVCRTTTTPAVVSSGAATRGDCKG